MRPRLKPRPARRRRCRWRLRKVEPLARALKPFAARINGRKRFQGGLRTAIPVVEADGARLKFYPFANVLRKNIDGIFRHADLRAHPLVGFGFRSVGRRRRRGKTECGVHTIETSPA